MRNQENAYFFKVQCELFRLSKIKLKASSFDILNNEYAVLSINIL